MNNNTAKLLDPTDVGAYRQAWQTTLPNLLPNLLFAYSGEETERMVSTYLDGKPLFNLLKLARAATKKGEQYRLIVHFGVDPITDVNSVGDAPGLLIMVQLHTKSTKKNANTFLLKWNASPRLPADDVRSGVDAIPAESAYLFIINWLETPYADLAKPFEATAGLMGKRVKSFIFSSEESKKIINILETADDAYNRNPKELEPARLSVHLGKGIAVWRHPFAFRPVIEAGADSFKLGTNSASEVTSRSASDDDDGNAFFDFSQPCPPYCDPE